MISIKTKKTHKLLFPFFILLLICVFSFGKVHTANASTCQCFSRTGIDTYNPVGAVIDTSSSSDCEQHCESSGANYYKYDNSFFISTINNMQAVKDAVGTLIDTVDTVIDTAIDTTGSLIIQHILLGILYLMGILLSAAATIFNWIIDPENMKMVMQNDVVYSTWATVRDTLNIAFILVLLFSAFATVFQVSSFSYKNILLKIVLMALLVNFSYPISRFIIDFSNSMMYYLISGLGITDSGGMFASIANHGALASIINPPASIQSNISTLLASIIFVWIFAITLLIIAGLFVIRTVALTLLIIFSAVAFTGSIIPFTAKYAGQWWENIFKYAFFGPVMIFMLSVATKMMAKISTDGIKSMTVVAGGQSIEPNLIASISFLSLPIIILWGGIIFAQQMSIMGAGAVIGRGQKFMKWAPNTIFKSFGIPGATKKALDYYGKNGAPGFLGKIPGLRGSEKTEATEAWLAAKVFRVKGAEMQDMKKRAEEYKKNNEDDAVLKQRASGGDAAAAYRLAEDKKIDQTTYDAFVSKNKNATIKTEVNGKVKQNRADIVATNKANDATELTKATNIAGAGAAGVPVDQYVAQQEIGKLSAEKWADQDWVKITEPPLTADKIRAVSAASWAFGKMDIVAKNELRKRITPVNKAALNGVGIPV